MCKNVNMKDWDDLKFILAIYRSGGLSAAARDLGVNHATVSRRLTAFEARKSLRLFDRFSDGMKPTSTGLKVIEAAQQMEQHYHAIDLELTAQTDDLSGPLKLAVPQLILKFSLLDILTEFKEKYPQIDLQIIATNEANIHRREADVTICGTDKPENSLWGRKLLSQKRGFYGSSDYLKNRNPEAPLKLVNFIWYGDKVLPQIKTHYPNAEIIAKFDDMVAALSAIENGMGVGRIPCIIGENAPNLIRLSKTDLEDYSDLWLLTHPDLRKTPKIKTFMDFVGPALIKKKNIFMGMI
ncbi:LysR family transcriptional regulator [Rhodospirillaceae bacterium RKSG073]|nr:LysR family transcriptional regulator [Curvivirga aplysinae]